MNQYSLYGQRISETYPRVLQITSGDTVLDGSGDTRSLYVNGNFSADTIFIGPADLYDIFAPIGAIGSGATTFIRNGLNTYTGGTLTSPTVNISAATLSWLSATSISGDTIYSGNTNLYSIFATIGSSGDIVRVQPGSNIITGGTDNFPIISVVANPSFGSITASGNSSFNTLSATSIYSGNTNLYDVFATIGSSGGPSTFVQPGLNTYTGGTTNAPTVNVSAATLSYLSATTISGDTIYSGNTNLYSIFASIGTSGSTYLNPTRIGYGNSNSGLTGTSTLTFIDNVSGNYTRGYLESFGAQIGNIAGPTFFRADQIKGWTNLEVEAQNGYIGFYNASGTERARIETDGLFRINTLSATTITGTSLVVNNALKYLDGNQGAQKVLTSDAFGNATWQDIPIYGVGTFMFVSGASDINSAYHQMVPLANYVQDGLQIHQSAVTTTPTIICSFATNPGYPGIRNIPVGTFACHYETEKVAGSNNYYTYFELYKYTTGGSEVYILSSDTTTESSVNTIIQNDPHAHSSSIITLDITDRLIVKIYAVMLSSSAQIKLYFDDSTGSSFTLPTTTVDTTHFVPYSGATSTVELGSNNLYANEIHGDYLFSGNTNLYDIFSTIGSSIGSGSTTYVQPGLNTYTGGTSSAPTVNISAATLSYLSASTISGGTFYGDGSGLSGLGNSITVSLSWKFDTSITPSDPGSGNFRFNNATLANISEIYVDTNTTNGINISVILDRLKSGSEIYVQQKDNPNTAVLFSVTSSTIDNSGWFTIPVAYVSDNGGSVPQNNKDCIFVLFNAPSVDSNTYVTGFTYDNSNRLTISQNGSSPSVSAVIDRFTGLTINGDLSAVTLTSQTIEIKTVAANYGLNYYNSDVLKWQVNVDNNNYLRFHKFGDTSDVFFSTNGEMGLGIAPQGVDKLLVNGSIRALSGVQTTFVSANTLTASTAAYVKTPNNTFVLSDGSASTYGYFSLNGNITPTTATGLIRLNSTALFVSDPTQLYFGIAGNSKFEISNSLIVSNVATYFLSAVTASQVYSPSISGTSISGATIYSGSTNLYDIFVTIGSSGPSTLVQPGLNTYTGGTSAAPTVNISAATLSSVSATTVSGGTLFSGFTNLSTTIISVANAAALANEDVTRVQAGSNIATGGTANAPTVSVIASPSLNNLFLSGSGQFAGVTSTGLSATTLSGGTLFSGATNLSTTIISVANAAALANEDVTRVQAGSNIATGGTANAPTVSVIASPSLNNLFLSGSGQFAGATATSFSATTLSAGTLYSGTTNLYNIFATQGASGEANTASNVNGVPLGTSVLATLFKQKTGVDLEFRTLSAGTNISFITGDTITIQATGSGSSTLVQPGLNTYTGGTSAAPTVNISAATLSSVSATTISGGSIYSGSTNIHNLFHQKNGYLLQKAGLLSGSTFVGSPRKSSVTFTTPFPNNLYSINVTGEINRTWSIESRTASGFTINSNSTTAFSSSVFWSCCEIGEGYR